MNILSGWLISEPETHLLAVPDKHADSEDQECSWKDLPRNTHAGHATPESGKVSVVGKERAPRTAVACLYPAEASVSGVTRSD